MSLSLTTRACVAFSSVTAITAIAAIAGLSVVACTATQQLGDRPSSETDAGPDIGDPDAAGTTPSTGVGDSGSPGTKDTTAPAVTLSVAPTTITAAGNLKLSVTASDASGVASVVLYAGGMAIATLTAPPYTVEQPVSQADNGTYVFTAEATDSAGNVGKSSPVTVNVNISGPPLPPVPTFVAAGTSSVSASATSLAVGAPAQIQTDDLLITVIDAQEESGPRTLATPAGWTLIPASESHGTWIFHKFATAAEPATTSFDFATASTARGVTVAYRGVDKSAPIHDKSALGFYGTGGTNGLGGGNTSLQTGRQVNLIATAVTAHATYTVALTGGSSITERFNSGEQPGGQNIIVHDTTIGFGIFTGPSIANKQSPSGTSDGFLFSATTLVLKPQ